ASTDPGRQFVVSKSTQPLKSRASASTGVMSLNWMPGWGKSGMLRMARCRSAEVTWGSLIFFRGVERRLLFHRFKFFDHFAEFGQGDVLNLPDALAGHAEFLADFLERLFAAAIEAKPVTQDGRLARVEGLHHFLQNRSDGLFLEFLIRRRRIFVLHHF